ncbi:MAG: cysteine hydrolase [Verrucomicrobiales bacterium]|nr:cysteine hydrolase [Verrucomicrobiales bacterium]
MPSKPVLIVVDLQRYYIDPESNFRRYPESRDPAAFQYIEQRCRDIVVPNVKKLLAHFRDHDWPVVFLRLCGQNPDRSDLHHSFRQSNEVAEAAGYPGIYPLADEPMADVVPDAAPLKGELVLDKVTFSGFTSSDIEDVLIRLDASELVFCGLATSQCVDTTARDAADRGYPVIHVEDAQADYSEMSHQTSLYASQGVCGGCVYSTEEVIEVDNPADLVY